MSKRSNNIFSLFLCLMFSLISISSFAQTQDEQLAAQYVEDREYAKAAELYEKLFKKSKNETFYSYYLNCLIALEDYAQAEETLKKLLKKDPENFRYIIDLGSIYNIS